jgi:prolyl oligopeptidase
MHSPFLISAKQSVKTHKHCVFLALLSSSLFMTAPMLNAQDTKPQTSVAKIMPTNPANLADETKDPRAFLEEVEGEASLKWVTERNQNTLTKLGADPRFANNQKAALAIIEATDRIPAPSFSKGGFIDNFWQDKTHVRGIWRRTTEASYASQTPKWETILDFDALAKSEGQNWVYKGSTCLSPEDRYCLIALSNGGKDAVTYREYDLKTRRFIEGGFTLPEGKQSVTWRDKDTLYVAREWEKGQVTQSGYAYVTKALKRGQSLDQAVEIHRGAATDMMAFHGVLRDQEGSYVLDYATIRPTFFEAKHSFVTKDGPISLPLPLTSEFMAYHSGQAIILIKTEFSLPSGQSFKPGQLIGFDLLQSLSAPNDMKAQIIFDPQKGQSLEGVSTTKSRLILSLLENVTGKIKTYEYRGNYWLSQDIDLPQNASLSLGSTAEDKDEAFVWATNFLTPSTLYKVDTLSGKSKALRSSPSRFDATGLKLEQKWATSKDGTKIPYFLVMKKETQLNGQTPTLLYAYGGFEVSMKPSYSGVMGKLWLENGGAYVLANIRGGGEFGPQWHKAGLLTNRQVIYDDFQAVAEALIADKITTPRRLGIMGGSNGGLLMGVQMTQRPDLWNAIIIQVPLLDMMRYHKLLAGASWQGEYGRPDDAAEGAFLKSISPYHNLKEGVAYPEPLFVTSTKDDRVHPGHARKMAALMDEAGLPYLYYENTDGGHAAAANLKETAKRNAIEYTYLMQKLMD